jgi:hypothetical protein
MPTVSLAWGFALRRIDSVGCEIRAKDKRESSSYPLHPVKAHRIGDRKQYDSASEQRKNKPFEKDRHCRFMTYFGIKGYNSPTHLKLTDPFVDH